jgi:hypothetical protein
MMPPVADGLNVGRVANLRPIANRPVPRMLFKIFEAFCASSEARRTLASRPLPARDFHPYSCASGLGGEGPSGAAHIANRLATRPTRESRGYAA